MEVRETFAIADSRLQILQSANLKSKIQRVAMNGVPLNGEPLRRTFTVTNPEGLHMRPITEFVEVASKFKSDVLVAKDGGEKIDGKSPFGLLGLVAEHGCELTLEVKGPDAPEAMTALLDVLAKTTAEA